MSGELTEPTTQRLDYLPLIGQQLKRLRIAHIVDERCRVDPRSAVTTGQCVEALITAILMGSHTLYMVDELLAPFDLELGLGFKASAVQFNDDRLAHALDEVFVGGPAEISSAAIVGALAVYELSLKRLHFDTSSVKVFGEYAASRAPEDPEDPRAIPHVTFGYSKDRRPDLKQILLGVTVTGDGAVPICGRVASGNRMDANENRFNIEQLAKIIPDLSQSTLIGDSKFFAGETLRLAAKYLLKFITMLPRTVGLWETAFAALQAAKSVGPIPTLRENQGGPLGATLDSWKGQSFSFDYAWEDEEKKSHTFPVRLLVIESTSLRGQKRVTLERHRATELARLEKASRALSKKKTVFKSAEEAEKDAKERVGSPRFHKVEIAVSNESRPVKRAGRGRPRADEPQRLEHVFRAVLTIQDQPQAFNAQLDRESTFVLATTLPSVGPGAQSDIEVFNSYREQHTVEGCHKWMKGPLAVAPVFLKSPSRIAALGTVYILALMTYALVQREVRSRLAATATQMPGNNKSWTSSPTTEVIFRLFAGVFTTRQPGGDVIVNNMNTEQVRLLELLKNDVLHRPGVTVATPRTPTRGQRGYRAP